MLSPKIAQVVVDLPAEGFFDYAIPEELGENIAIGQRVSILFARRKMVGFVVGLKQESDFEKLNPILSLLDYAPVLDQNALLLTKEFSAYYGCSWGEAIATYLPAVLRKASKKNINILNPPIPLFQRGAIHSSLPLYQRGVRGDLKKLIKETASFYLIHDQGLVQRWAFIRGQISEILSEGKQVIFLVPEVSFINKVKEEINHDYFVLDKKLNKQVYQQMQQGSLSIILGTRSAIFAPFPNLGLIIVYDEEHDFYKQEQTPHYHVRQVAQMRARLEGCKVCFISSVPSAEIWKEAQKKSWKKATFKEEHSSSVQIVDMNNYNPQKTSIISFPLQNHMASLLEQGKRVVLFMNRRGSFAVTKCSKCDFTLKCLRCDVHLISLSSKNKMICRHCNATTAIPKICPNCKGKCIRSRGKGVEKLAQSVKRMYPGATVGCYDKDYPNFPEKAQIIIATQLILNKKEEMDFDLIAVLNFDSALHHMDFRSAQKAFGLLVHLKQMTKEKFIVQTYIPDNYVLKSIRKDDFNYFYRQELSFRKETMFPPYQHLIILVIRGLKEADVLMQSQRIFDALMEDKPENIEISDVHPDVNPKLRDKYRFSILLKGKSVKDILPFLKQTLKKVSKKKGIIVTIDVDY